MVPAVRDAINPHVLNPEDVHSLHWQQSAEALLIKQDQAVCIATFVCLLGSLKIYAVHPHVQLAFCICSMLSMMQLWWMLRHPRTYKHHRECVCSLLRIWCTYMVCRFAPLLPQSGCSTRQLLRTLLLASGSLCHCLIAFAHQLKPKHHIPMQIMGVMASMAATTEKVVKVLSHEAHVATIRCIYEVISSISSTLIEGASFAGHQALGCHPNKPLAVVLMTQIFVGIALPTYILLVADKSSEERFKARLRLLRSSNGYQLAPITCLDAMCMALFSLMAHTLVLAIIGSALWEAICCATCTWMGSVVLL